MSYLRVVGMEYRRVKTEDVSQLLSTARRNGKMFPHFLSRNKSHWLFGEVIHGPKEATFAEAAIGNLEHLLGKQWWSDQNQLPAADKHPLATWFDHYRKYSGKFHVELARTGFRFLADTTGLVQCLVALAFDVAALQAKDCWSQSLLKRVRDSSEFQGVRYEIAVAKIFIFSAFDIRWLTDESGTHPEFEATYVPTKGKDVVQVEAKSRQYRNVLGSTSGSLSQEAKAGIGNLLERARGQAPKDKPCIAFFDINQASGKLSSTDLENIGKELQKEFGDYLDGSADNPARFNLEVVTNYSWHYFGEEIARGGRYWISKPLHPKHPLPGDAITRIIEELPNYGHIPDRFMFSEPLDPDKLLATA